MKLVPLIPAHKPTKIVKPIPGRRYIDSETGEIVEIAVLSQRARKSTAFIYSHNWNQMHRTIFTEIAPYMLLVVLLIVLMKWGR